MAEETTIALKVEIGGSERAITNLKEMKEAMSALKKEQETLALGSQAFTENQKKIDDLNNALKSLSDSPALSKLKTALKEAQNAALNGDGKAAKRVAELQDEINDLKDATVSLQGSGIERLKSGFGLLKESFGTADMGKATTGLKAIGSAMAAIPVFLIVEGIMKLYENFDKLKTSGGLVGKVFSAIGDAIDFVGDKLEWFADKLGLIDKEISDLGEQTVKNAEASKEALSQQNAEYDRQIKVAKAAGKSTVEIEKAKQQAIIDTNVQIVKQIEAFVRAGGVLDEEKKKLLTASLESIKNAKTDIEVIDLDHLKKEKERREKASKEAQDRKEKEKAEAEKEKEKKLQAQRDLYASMMAIYKEGQDELKAQAKEADDNFKDTLNKQAEGIVENGKKRQAAAKEENDKDLALYKEKMQQKRDIEAKSIQATQALTDLYFAHQLRQAKGNADREREIKKKQFNMNKAFGITMAVIDGVRSVQAALTQTPPLSYVLAALNAVLAVANVAKIASAKFDDGGGSVGGGADIGGGTGISGGSAPAIAQPSNTVTKIDDNGEIKKAKEETPTVKAVVVETDITDKQKRVNTIQEAASI